MDHRTDPPSNPAPDQPEKARPGRQQTSRTTPTEEAFPKTSSSAWTVRCAQAVVRLRASANSQPDAMTPARSAHLVAANNALLHAQQALDQFTSSPMPKRLLTSSASYVAVLADLQTATEQLLYVQSDEALLGLVPDLAGAVRNYLAADDPRRETYLTYLANLRTRSGQSPAPIVDEATAETDEAPDARANG